MTSYNGWTYTWNGENRLVAAENSDTRLEFSYDYMGRRLEKKVYSKGLLTLYDWSLEKHRKFVYDGYKLIAEFEVEDDNATLFASYLWQPESVGLDVPLMRIADNTETYYIADGNKNIIALKDSSGADVSTYAYTPFGSLENPADGDENPFRFSSEYADDETGLVYYNYRYYSPQLGRWTKRDPIEEQGGINIYGMCQNNVIGAVDSLGFGWLNDYIYEPMSKATKFAITLTQVTAGIPFSILSGDVVGLFIDFDPVFSDKGCEFLITVNGIFNTRSGAEELRKNVQATKRYKHINPQNTVAARNYTTYLGDFVQILGDELGTINYASVELASIIKKASKQAKRNKCNDCYKIHIVAHSQGTSVFYRALPLVDEKIYPHIYFYGLGGQRFANDISGLGGNENGANIDDIVPYIGNYNPFRLFGIPRNIFGSGGNVTWYPSTGGWGTSHPWQKNYIHIFTAVPYIFEIVIFVLLL